MSAMRIEKEVEFRTKLGRIIAAHAGQEQGEYAYRCVLVDYRDASGAVEPTPDLPRCTSGAHLGDAILTFRSALNMALGKLWPHDGITEMAQVKVQAVLGSSKNRSTA